MKFSGFRHGGDRAVNAEMNKPAPLSPSENGKREQFRCHQGTSQTF
jgi:hypothetical protein